MYQTKVVEKITTYIFFVRSPFLENRAVYDIMWKIFIELGRQLIKIWRMHVACWVPKTTNTHSKYVILIAFPLQQWLRERSSVLSTLPVSFIFKSDCKST
jgi:hypothetical protein